jgi:hypothetical protein
MFQKDELKILVEALNVKLVSSCLLGSSSDIRCIMTTTWPLCGNGASGLVTCSCPCYFWAIWSLVRKKRNNHKTSWHVFHEEIIIGELLALWQLTVAPPGHHFERRQQNSRLFELCSSFVFAEGCRFLSRLCFIGTEVLGCKRRYFVCRFWDSCGSCFFLVCVSVSHYSS